MYVLRPPVLRHLQLLKQVVQVVPVRSPAWLVVPPLVAVALRVPVTSAVRAVKGKQDVPPVLVKVVPLVPSLRPFVVAWLFVMRLLAWVPSDVD